MKYFQLKGVKCKQKYVIISLVADLLEQEADHTIQVKLNWKYWSLCQRRIKFIYLPWNMYANVTFCTRQRTSGSFRKNSHFCGASVIKLDQSAQTLNSLTDISYEGILPGFVTKKDLCIPNAYNNVFSWLISTKIKEG